LYTDSLAACDLNAGDSLGRMRILLRQAAAMV
jgi:hypothetical protein